MHGGGLGMGDQGSRNSLQGAEGLHHEAEKLPGWARHA